MDIYILSQIYIKIYNVIKSLNRDTIEERQLINLKREIEKIYKKIPNTEHRIINGT